MAKKLRRAALASAGIVALYAHPALAQSAPDAESGTRSSTDQADAEGDIVVTAQRRAERLQDVPIAITALDSAILDDRGVADITDLRGTVPSLSISTFAGVNASNLLSIRGITGQPLPIGSGQAVAIYLDGVYLSRPDAGVFALDDVERIEVLRGPQGTLYGRNATAGAINIITTQPDDELRGGFDLSYGRFGNIRARGSVSGPIAGGLSAGLSAAYETRDGWFTNTLTGSRIGDYTSSTIRGRLRYQNPAGTFDLTVSGDISAVDAQQLFKALVSPAGVLLGIGDPRLITTDIGDRIRTEIDSRGLSAVANFEVSDAVTLTSISSFRDVDTFTSFDGDSSAAPAFWTVSDNSSETFSQEIRAVVTLPRFRATIGGNYYHEEGELGFSALPSAATPSLTSPFDTTDLDAYALFGQFEFDLARTLTIVGGLRFNRESRDFSIDYRQARPTPGVFVEGRISDSALLPSIGINFEPANDILLYAKASQGYQAPGFNFAPGVQAAANTFSAEELWAYEVGAKTQFFNRRLTFNIAGFYYDYKDIQVRSVVAPGVTLVNNAASATVRGVEAELVVRPARGLTLGGQLTYLDASYNSYCEPISIANPVGNDPLCSAGFADRSDNRLSQAPRWTGGVNANYQVALSADVELRANVSYSFESSVFFSAVNETAASNQGWDRLDARIGVQLADGPEIYLYGRNLTDERYLGQINRLAPTVVIGSISEPRTYGAGLRYRF